MQNETLVYHLEDKHTPTRTHEVNRLSTPLSSQRARQTLLKVRFEGVEVVEIFASVTHLDDHFKGEHSREDIIEITQDLKKFQTHKLHCILKQFYLVLITFSLGVCEQIVT